MVPQILKPPRQKDIFNSKTSCEFNIKVPVCDGMALHSDFIFNTNVINDDLLGTSISFPFCINQRYFEIFSKIYNEAGRSIFNDNIPSLNTIPRKYLNPPIHIKNYQFHADLGNVEKFFMTMVSLHDPLNISFDSMMPFANFFNSADVKSQILNFVIFFSRIPIFIMDTSDNANANFYVTCLGILFGLQCPEFLNYFIVDGNANTPEFNRIKALFQHKFLPQVPRILAPNEYDNVVYDISYSDGRFMGVNSPQVQDFYVNYDNNVESNFNNVSALKCILEMNNLGAVFNYHNKYTLTNAAVFMTYDGQQLKFTGKYLKGKNFSTIDDNNLVSSDLARICYDNFRNQPGMVNMLQQEINFDMIAFNNYAVNRGNNHFISTYNSALDINPPANQFNIIHFSVKNLFSCTLGLEDYMKSNFALFLSGIYGHLFDNVLKYFEFDVIDLNNSLIEANTFRALKPSFNITQHLGSPLASYCLDFKTHPEKNILMGYNLGNLGRCIDLKMIHINDKVAYNTNYFTRNRPLALFPVVFQNINFVVNVSCWRSWKNLLMTMNTRKQRDLVLDNLNQYGRRIFTILDPYGIFLHFHNETRGLRAADDDRDN